MNCILIYMTVPTGEAERICSLLLERRLIACANILPTHKAMYRWEGKIENHEQECAVIMKTVVDKYPELEQAVLELHPYDVPCLVQLDITGGHKPFLAWIGEEISS